MRVPALITDDVGTLVDSATILDYLDRRVDALALECAKLAALSKRPNLLPEFAATRPPGY